MSALAKFFHAHHINVQGSDTKQIDGGLSGISYYTKHAAENLENATHVIISSAIDLQNPERREARKRELPVIKRGDLLGLLTKNYKTIGVTGSHGKTTTTSLIGSLLKKGNLDPTILCGGVMRETNDNFLHGSSPWLVTELDESDGSHQKAFMKLGIITNIDCEHMDFYKTPEKLRSSFEMFLKNISPDGLGIVCIDNPLVGEIILKSCTPLMTYGFSKNAKVCLKHYRAIPEGSIFDVELPDRSVYQDIRLNLHGQHNVQNAGAALAVAHHLGLSEEVIRQAFQNFQGTQRRFNNLGTVMGVRFFDDYAHHPVEIKATLKTAKTLTKGRLIAVCEIHRYTRLRELFSEFTTCFEQADVVLFLPLYSAGENPLPMTSTQQLTKALSDKGKQALHFSDLQNASKSLLNLLRPDDFVICMGAGQSTHFAQSLPKMMHKLSASQQAQSVSQ